MTWEDGKSIGESGRQRRGKEDRDEIDPRVKRMITIELRADQGSRSPRALAMDQARTNKNVLDPAKKEDRDQWRSDKGSSDLAGVDAPYDALKKANQDAAARLERQAEDLKKITDSDMPMSFKLEKVNKIEAETKKVLGEAHDQIEEIHRKGGPNWNEKRKDEAEMVKDATGIRSLIQADALVQRARRKGREPDTVDWDAMQGSDLAFSDQVRRLDEQVGSTETEAEMEGEIGNEIEAYGHAYDDYLEGVKRANFEFGSANDNRSIKKILQDMKKDSKNMTDQPDSWVEQGPDKSDLIGWDDKSRTDEKDEFRKEAKQLDNPGVDEWPGQFRYRVNDPSEFEWLKTKYPGDNPESGVSFIVGKDEESDSSSDVQAIRFDKDKGWTKEKVEDWLTKNKDEIKSMKV